MTFSWSQIFVFLGCQIANLMIFFEVKFFDVKFWSELNKLHNHESKTSGIHHHPRSLVLVSLVSRPTCAFHFSTAVGLVHFLTCVTRRVEGWIFTWARIAAVLRQRRKAANLYFLQLLFRAHLCHRPSAETMSPAEGREVQPSFERSLPKCN